MVPAVASHLQWGRIHHIAAGIVEDFLSVHVSVGAKVTAVV